MNITVKESNYKGNPVLQFFDADKPPPEDGKDAFPVLAFGVKKGRIILENFSAIKEFVEAHPKDDEGEIKNEQ